MSIAGFDPSGGAGTLADVKTFEQHKVYGFAVITANTFQNDKQVKRVDWLPVQDILSQIDVILDRFEVKFFKIGIVSGAEMLHTIKEHIRKRVSKPFISWDPVLKASAGNEFFNGQISVSELMEGLNLITPNAAEFEILFKSEDQALKLSASAMVYLKGGHNESKPGYDVVFNKGKRVGYNSQESRATAKHGSGCVLASALTANLALGFKVHQSVLKSKRYIEAVLSSNEELLAYHKR